MSQFSAGLEMIDSYGLMADGRLRIAHRVYQPRYQSLLSVYGEEGRLVWEEELGAPAVMRPIQSDNSVLVNDSRSELMRFDSAGKLLWTIRARRNELDCNSFAVTQDKTLIVWIGKELRYFDLDGNSQGAALHLGTAPSGWSMDSLDFFTGADGNYYIQVEPTDGNGNTVGKNAILALDPGGQPLWRIELGDDNFDLIAGGYSGELFGKRRGANISAGKWTGADHCDYVCLIPDSGKAAAH